MSPISYRPSNFSSHSSGLGGPGSGTTELSHAGLSAGVESQVTGSAQAHQFIHPRPDIGLLSATPLPPGAESAALNAVHGAAAGQVSPIIQMIMRLPGHIGLASSFFEALAHMFAPATNLLSGLDLSNLVAQAHEAAQATVSALSEHIPIDPSLLPAEAPILHDLQAQGLTASSLSESHTGLSAENLNVSGTVSPGKPLFESSHQGLTNKTMLARESGIISGPSMSQSITSHLSGNHRLFTDQIDLAPRSSSISSLPSLPSGTGLPTGYNVGASPFGQQAGSLPAMAQIKDGLLSGPELSKDVSFQLGSSGHPALDGSNLGPSGAVSDQLGGQHLLASNTLPADQPSLASASGNNLNGGSSDLPSASADASPTQDGPAPIELRAKQLSLQDFKNMQHGASAKPPVAHSKASTPTSTTSTAAVKQTHPVVDQIAQRSTNTVHSDNSSLAKSIAKPHHTTAHKAVEKPVIETPQQVQPSNDTVAAAPEAQPVNDGGTYTIRAGDNLWNIARDHLGGGSRWQEIYKLNQDILGSNPGLIQPGTTIHLPGAGSEIATTSGADASVYTVHPGDNLWDIAKSHMGGGDRWSEIYKANTDIIGSNPGIIHPGQHLNMPGSVPMEQISSAQPQPTVGSPPADPISAPSAASPPDPAFGSPNTSQLPIGQPVASSATNEVSMLPGAQASPSVSSNSNSIVPSSLRPDLSFLFGKSGK